MPERSAVDQPELIKETPKIHSTSIGSLREKAGDANFNPSKPEISKKSTQTTESFVKDTNTTFDVVSKTHHGDRLKNLYELSLTLNTNLLDSLLRGEITNEQYLDIISQKDALALLSGIVDPLTFAERPDQKQWVFDNAKKKAQKYGKQIYVLELDLSGFKGINDDPKLGHLKGDEVLRKVGTFLTKGSIQEIPADPAAEDDGEPTESGNSFSIIRNGGDEFVIVEVGEHDKELTLHKKLLDKTPDQMRLICSELGINYEEHPIIFHAGVTTMSPDQSPEDAIFAADQELIKSKDQYYADNPHLNRRK